MNVRGVCFAVALAALVTAPASLAGAGGSWQPIERGSAQEVSGIGQSGIVRGADGTLHVAFSRQTGTLSFEVAHRTISPTGRPGARTRLFAGPGLAQGVALALAGSELRAYFPVDGLGRSTSSDGGRSWSPTALVYDRDFVGARTPSVAVAGDAELQTWYAVGETVVHAGLDKATDAVRYCPPGEFCSGTTQNIASNPSGEAYVVWCTWSAPSSVRGIWVQRVDASNGAPAGPPMPMPGSTTTFEGQEIPACQGVSHRTPLVARAGGGFFTAIAGGYPSRSEVRLWRVGAGRPTVVHKGGNVGDLIALAATPEGRLWVAWTDGENVFVRRSNRSATRWGNPIALRDPRGEESGPGVLDLAAQTTRLDVLGRYPTVSGQITLYHRQVLAPLEVESHGRKRRLVQGDGRGRAGRRRHDQGRRPHGPHERAGPGDDRPAGGDVPGRRDEGGVREGHGAGALALGGRGCRRVGARRLRPAARSCAADGRDVRRGPTARGGGRRILR